MLVEYFYSTKKQRIVHIFDESVANLNVGIAERLCDLQTSGTFLFVFTWIYDNYGSFRIKPAFLTWILLFLATDFVWYWYHRYAHENNLFFKC